MTALPPVDAQFYNEEIETMPRPQLEELQLERLLDLIPHAYEHSALIRETWDAVKVKPADIRTLADVQEKTGDERNWAPIQAAVKALK